MAEDKKTVVKMAYIYSQEGRWDKAAAEYKKLIAMDPEDYNAQNMLGDVFVKKGEHQEAFNAYVVVADAYSRLGQPEKTTVVCRKIAKLDSSQLSGVSKKKQTMLQKQVEGEAALEAGDLANAAEAFKAVLQLDTERFDIYQKLGDIYLQQGQTEHAVKQYVEIADIYFKNKLYKKAAPLYKKILELDPAHVEAHAGLGEIHVRSGNESEAKKEYLLIAESLLAKDDIETSITYSKKALQLKSIEAYYFLGRAYLKQKKHEDAKAEFEKLLKFKLNHSGALAGMGEISQAKGQLPEAQQFFERAVKADKTNAEGLAGLVALLVKKGENEKAANLYFEAAEACAGLNLNSKAQEFKRLGEKLHPESDHAHEAVEEAPVPAPQPSAAPLAAVPMAVLPAPSAPPLAAVLPPPSAPAAAEIDPAEERAVLMSMADNYVMEKSYDEAIELYQRILAANPQDSQAKEALTGVYSLVGKKAFPEAKPQPQAAQPVVEAAPAAVAAQAAEEAEKLAKQAEAEMRKHLEIEIRKQLEEELRHKMAKQAAEAAAAPVAAIPMPEPAPVAPAPPSAGPTPVPVVVAPVTAPAPPVTPKAHEADTHKKKSKVSYL